MTTFWTNLKKPFTVLAPMANVTDWAFRQTIMKTGRPDVFYTEFVSADGICAAGIERFKAELYFEPAERPIVAQIFGATPDHFEKSARIITEMGFDGVDINMGCPDRSVDKQGSGAALIKNPKLAQNIIRTVKRAVGDLPVSVKTRIGYNKIETESWIPYLLECNIQALTVHGRTKKEMSKVPAHWDEIGKASQLAKGSGTLVIGNGDITTLKEAYEKAQVYNLDGIMIGRGIFSNPWLFQDKINPALIFPDEKIKLMLYHLKNFEALHGNNKNFDVFKRFIKIYISNWPGAKELRDKLMISKNSSQILETIGDFKKIC